MAQDPVDALVGIDLFLNRDFVWRTGLEAAADANVEALGVLAEDDEVHVGGRPVLQRTQPLVEQPDRTIVHVQVELEPRAEQDVARMAIVGHARIAERADEHRVELPEQRVAVFRNRDARREEVVGAPRQRLDLDAAAGGLRDGGDDGHCRGRHLGTDSISRDDGDLHQRDFRISGFEDLRI